MAGLSDLNKTKYFGPKKKPHNLAWINDKEVQALKELGGYGKPVKGSHGIPIYDTEGYDDEGGYAGDPGAGTGTGGTGGTGGQDQVDEGAPTGPGQGEVGHGQWDFDPAKGKAPPTAVHSRAGPIETTWSYLEQRAKALTEEELGLPDPWRENQRRLERRASREGLGMLYDPFFDKVRDKDLKASRQFKGVLEEAEEKMEPYQLSKYLGIMKENNMPLHGMGYYPNEYITPVPVYEKEHDNFMKLAKAGVDDRFHDDIRRELDNAKPGQTVGSIFSNFPSVTPAEYGLTKDMNAKDVNELMNFNTIKGVMEAAPIFIGGALGGPFGAASSLMGFAMNKIGKSSVEGIIKDVSNALGITPKKKATSVPILPTRKTGKGVTDRLASFFGYKNPFPGLRPDYEKITGPVTESYKKLGSTQTDKTQADAFAKNRPSTQADIFEGVDKRMPFGPLKQTTQGNLYDALNPSLRGLNQPDKSRWTRPDSWKRRVERQPLGPLPKAPVDELLDPSLDPTPVYPKTISDVLSGPISPHQDPNATKRGIRFRPERTNLSQQTRDAATKAIKEKQYADTIARRGEEDEAELYRGLPITQSPLFPSKAWNLQPAPLTRNQQFLQKDSPVTPKVEPRPFTRTSLTHKDIPNLPGVDVDLSKQELFQPESTPQLDALLRQIFPQRAEGGEVMDDPLENSPLIKAQLGI